MTDHDRTAVLKTPIESFVPGVAELAAVAFLARYSGRTLDAYHHDLRNLSSGPLTTAWRCLKRPAPIWTCIEPRWRIAGWPPSRSTVACRPHADSPFRPYRRPNRFEPGSVCPSATRAPTGHPKVKNRLTAGTPRVQFLWATPS